MLIIGAAGIGLSVELLLADGWHVTATYRTATSGWPRCRVGTEHRRIDV
jgi:hypothetical protein